MPQQFIIKGNVFLSDNPGIFLEGKVKAFDNDLPSLNRPPELLGESSIGENGSFNITYTLEQFYQSESVARSNGIRQQSPDLSFKVLDSNQKELVIKIIEVPALNNRTFKSEELIFNAPSELEVKLYVVAVAQFTNGSEFEKLITAISPIIENIPFAQLTDKDMHFLSAEAVVEMPDLPNRLEWVRRSAILAVETELPIEALYGWGRQDVPARLEELSIVPLEDLQKVLEKLSSLEDEKLHSALGEAIEGNIIPNVFNERIDEIIRRLKRRNQLRKRITAQLCDRETEEFLSNYTVTSFEGSSNESNEVLGLDITNSEGKFSFTFFTPLETPENTPERNFHFEIQTPEGNKLEDDGRISIKPDQQENEIVVVKIKIPSQEIPSIQQHFEQLQIPLPEEVLAFFADNSIKSFADIRRKGGIKKLNNFPQIESDLMYKLIAFVDLDRITSKIQVSAKLIEIEKEYDSVLGIAETPRSEFVKKVKGSIGELDELESNKLHVKAKAQTDFLNTLLAGMAADQANGFKY